VPSINTVTGGLGRCNASMRKGWRAGAGAGAAAAVVLVLASCGGSAPAGSPDPSARCAAAAVHHGPPPAWTAAAWADSSPGFSVPYSVATGSRAAAFFFAKSLRAGHPTDPANKVLWVVGQPRQGMPLTISARRIGDRSPTVRISEPADSGPGEIYPSYVDLPRAGCWRLALAWAGHRAAINVHVAPARVAPVAVAPQAAQAPAGAAVPRPLHGTPLTGRTGLRLLVAADPPFVLNVDSGRATPVTGVNTRGDPVLTVQPVGRDTVVWADGRAGRTPPIIYVVRHGSARAIRIGTGSVVAPADHGHGLWLISAPRAHHCSLREISLRGQPLRQPRQVRCSSRLVAVGTGSAVLVTGRRMIAPDTGRTLRTGSWLWAIADGWALTSAGSQPPLRLLTLQGSAVRLLRWPSRIGATDDAVGEPGGRLIALDFGDPAFRQTSTQVMDAWLLDPVTARFRHLPDMPAAVALKATSMEWAPGRRLVILAAVDRAGGRRNLVAVWRPGQRQFAVRTVRLPARNSGSDTFLVR
jgi:hypothetical protein